MKASIFTPWIIALLLQSCCLLAVASPRLVGMGEEHDSIPFSRVLEAGLPVLDVATVDGEWPTAEYVRAPTGYMGKGITNATNVPGRMVMYHHGGVVYDSGDFQEGARGMRIRIRGNSSAWADKKPYKLTLEQKADLMFRNNPSCRDRDWVLLRDEFLYAVQGFEVNRRLGMEWTPAYHCVNLVLNNEYLGVYMLVESVKRNTNCRISVASNGFIVEHDAYWWLEDYHVISQMHLGMHYTFKYPSTADLTRSDKDFIKARLADYEASLNDGTYPDHVDVVSLAKWCLGQDILGTRDSGGTNRYFALKDRQPATLFTVPLMWDFDAAEMNPTWWSRSHTMVMQGLFDSPNRAFVDAFVAAWNEVSPTLAIDMIAFFSSFAISEQGKGYVASMDLNNARWDMEYEASTYVNSRAFWFLERTEWLNNYIGKLNPYADVDINGIVDVSDLNQLINMMIRKTPTNLRVADLNQDGVVDVDDANILMNILVKKNG
ncbi:MAG: CotH kinase family protein [Muribaculaceae bacterium]|nr:CotH kinase family protein [Muribaculaceae bacterium]